MRIIKSVHLYGPDGISDGRPELTEAILRAVNDATFDPGEGQSFALGNLPPMAAKELLDFADNPKLWCDPESQSFGEIYAIVDALRLVATAMDELGINQIQ